MEVHVKISCHTAHVIIAYMFFSLSSVSPSWTNKLDERGECRFRHGVSYPRNVNGQSLLGWFVSVVSNSTHLSYWPLGIRTVVLSTKYYSTSLWQEDWKLFASIHNSFTAQFQGHTKIWRFQSLLQLNQCFVIRIPCQQRENQWVSWS